MGKGWREAHARQTYVEIDFPGEVASAGCRPIVAPACQHQTIDEAHFVPVDSAHLLAICSLPVRELLSDDQRVNVKSKAVFNRIIYILMGDGIGREKKVG